MESFIKKIDKAFSKPKTRLIAGILSAATILTLVGIDTASMISKTINDNQNTSQTEHSDAVDYGENNYTFENKEKSLDDINPNFKFKKWLGEEYLTIDEESLLEIIKIAMKDAKKFYLDMGATNMKLDKNGNHLQGDENFYTDWFNEYYVLAMAKRETDIYMINYRSHIDEDLHKDPQGVMSINPCQVIDTLKGYFSTIYGKDINLDAYAIFPSEKDVANYKNPESAKNLKQIVYNNVLMSIYFNIYKTKCTGANHKDYYEKYGGFNEDLRKTIVSASYLFKINEVLEAAKNGTLVSEYGNTEYVSGINKWQKTFEEKYGTSMQYQLGE